MAIVYSVEPSLPVAEFRDVLIASSLRRPVDDLERLEAMLRNSNLVITARAEGRLVGISRAITDFSYCCYLSDLAVDAAYQRQGIGKRLVEETRQRAGDLARLILVAAPAANSYYPKIGMISVPNCWMIDRAKHT